MNKKHIAKSFGNASQTYESDAPVQKWTASYLRNFVANLKMDQKAECLEIGCGTGFLTKEMSLLLPSAEWTITDLSQDMVTECMSNVPIKANFQIMDGEHPNIEKSFDLIVTSLAIQWFHDLEKGLQRLTKLLKPGGHLIFTTLGRDSFKEWRINLEKLGLPIGLHDYPSSHDISKFIFQNAELELEIVPKVQPYDSGLSFLRALKAIGAQAPHGDYKPLDPASLRKAVRHLEKTGDCSMTYEIFLGCIHKKEAK